MLYQWADNHHRPFLWASRTPQYWAGLLERKEPRKVGQMEMIEFLISDYFNEDDPLLLSDLFIEFECFSSVANKPHTRRVLLGKPLISLPRHQFWDF